MNKFLVSIGISIYNTQEFIERSLRSYFSQSMAENIQYVLVNDASTDDSYEIAKKVISEFPRLKDNITLLSHEHNTKVATCRNEELELFTGDYVMFCDSDDYADPDHVENLYKKALEKDYDFVCCNLINEYEGGKEVYETMAICDSIEDFTKKAIQHDIPAYLWNKLLKRKIIEEHHIRSRSDIYPLDDYFFFNSFLLHTKSFAYIPNFSIHYNRTNNLSITNSKKKKNRFFGIVHTLHETQKVFMEAADYSLYEKSFFISKMKSRFYWFSANNFFYGFSFRFFDHADLEYIKKDPLYYELINWDYINISARFKIKFRWLIEHKYFNLVSISFVLYVCSRWFKARVIRFFQEVRQRKAAQ